MQAALLPVRHPNADFFIADVFDSIPVKADRHTMEHPFFALSTKPDIRVVEYKKSGVYVKLVPHHQYGLPTMMDKDILLYVGSLLMHEINAGHIPLKTVRFSAHDLLVTTNRHTNDIGYRNLANAFERITGCLITTDIKTNDTRETAGFHILDKYRVIESSHNKRRMVRVEVTVSDWFYNALLGREVLTINRDYFRLRKPLERRLYELARKHCGRQAQWQIGLEQLREKCGALSPLKNFRFQLRDIIHPTRGQKEKEKEGEEKEGQKTDTQPSPHFPDYQMTLDDKDMVTFSNRYEMLKASLEHAAVPAAPPSVRQALTPATTRRGARIVEKAGTGWNYGAIIDQFSQALDNGFAPDNLNAAFIGFVKKKVRQRP